MLDYLCDALVFDFGRKVVMVFLSIELKGMCDFCDVVCIVCIVVRLVGCSN